MVSSLIYYILIASALLQITGGDDGWGTNPYGNVKTTPYIDDSWGTTPHETVKTTPYIDENPLSPSCRNKTGEKICDDKIVRIYDWPFLGSTTCKRALEYMECYEKLYEYDLDCKDWVQEELLRAIAKEQLLPDEACYCCNEIYAKLLKLGYRLIMLSDYTCIPDEAKRPKKYYECVTCKYGTNIFDRIFEHAKTCDQLLTAGRTIEDAINKACRSSENSSETLIKNYFIETERFILEKDEYCFDKECNELTAFMQSHIGDKFTLQFKFNSNSKPQKCDESSAARHYDYSSAIPRLLGAWSMIIFTFNFL